MFKLSVKSGRTAESRMAMTIGRVESSQSAYEFQNHPHSHELPPGGHFFGSAFASLSCRLVAISLLTTTLSAESYVDAAGVVQPAPLLQHS